MNDGVKFPHLDFCVDEYRLLDFNYDKKKQKKQKGPIQFQSYSIIFLMYDNLIILHLINQHRNHNVEFLCQDKLEVSRIH